MNKTIQNLVTNIIPIQHDHVLLHPDDQSCVSLMSSSNDSDVISLKMRHGDTNVNVDTLGCLLEPLQLGQRWLDARGEDGVHHELFVHESLPAVPVALRHLEVPIVGDLSSNGVDFLGFPLLTMRCDA